MLAPSFNGPLQTIKLRTGMHPDRYSLSFGGALGSGYHKSR